jgi:peptidoglycan hydrolase-like protein with peptidoglycan-binding domain
MGTKYGVLVASARNRSWTAGGLIPGCTYGGAPAPTPPPAPPSGRPSPRVDKPYLVQGAKGPAVAEMQQLLIKLGIGQLAKYGATGNFLEVTYEAVGLFQEQVRSQQDATMVVDHECGPVTWGWLYFLAG